MSPGGRRGCAPALALLVAGVTVAAAFSDGAARIDATRQGVFCRSLHRTVEVATVLSALSGGLVAMVAALRCGRPLVATRLAERRAGFVRLNGVDAMSRRRFVGSFRRGGRCGP